MDLTRRNFLLLTGGASCALASGCATNPVTGRKQLMFVSEQNEIALDQKWAPHQFSADYGAVQNSDINEYISGIGNRMAKLTHRPQMPYNFRVLNTVVVNGYTFPAGSVGLARGLMIAMENEAQLAAVIGHELAHVNHRHSSSRQTKGLLASGAVIALAAYLEHEESEYTQLSAGLGAIGANLLLSRYSREHERQADSTGMQYAVKSGYPAQGMSELMEVFMRLKQKEPSVVELLFATHPLSEERYRTAQKRAKTVYSGSSEFSSGRERYMDNIAGLRAKADAIRKLQDGEALMRKSKYTEAEEAFKEALEKEPDDYAGLMLMAKCQISKEQYVKAVRFSDLARQTYPGEPQAHHISGIANLKAGKYSEAFQQFSQYERLLPGNDNTIFYKGLSLEKEGRRKKAAQEYIRYCRNQTSGEQYEYAMGRLRQWGYVKANQTDGAR